MLKSREERERERERRAVEHLAVDYRAQHSLLDARDTQIDDLKAAVERLRDTLVQRDMALAASEQALRAARAEAQLRGAQVDRLEAVLRQAGSSHDAALQTAAHERQEAMGALGARLEAHEAAVGQLQHDRDSLTEQRSRLQAELAAAQRHGEQLGGELRAAQQRAADLARALETSKEEAAKGALLRDARISELQAQLLLVGRAEGARAAERDADVAVWVDRCNALRATCERQGAELEAVRRAERRAAAAAEEAEQRVREEQGAGSAVREQLAGAQAELRQQRARCSALEMELRQLQRRQQLQGRGQLAGEADEWSDEEEGWGDGVQRLEAVPGRLAWSSNGSWGGGLAGYGGQWKQQRGAAAVAAAAAAAEVTGAGVGGARSAVRSKASAALRRLESLTSTWSAAEGVPPFGRGDPPTRAMCRSVSKSLGNTPVKAAAGLKAPSRRGMQGVARG